MKKLFVTLGLGCAMLAPAGSLLAQDGAAPAERQTAQPVQPASPDAPKVEAVAPKKEGKNLIETAKTMPELKEFVALVTEVNLLPVLEANGPFTLFAPTNEAMQAFGKEKWAKLKEAENLPELYKTLLFHLTAGANKAEAVAGMEADGMMAVSGSKIRVKKDDKGGITVGEAKLVRADVECNNGVLHIIDKVNTPPAQ